MGIKLEIEMRLDNSAFGESHDEMVRELSSVLGRLTARVGLLGFGRALRVEQSGGVGAIDRCGLSDANGNSIGSVRLIVD